MLYNYSSPTIYIIRPFSFRENDVVYSLDINNKLKLLNQYLKTSKDPIIQSFKNKLLYQLCDYDVLFTERQRFYADNDYLRKNGKLINIVNLPDNNVDSTESKLVVKIFKLNDDYYMDLSESFTIYLISTYSGIFNLIEATHRKFIFDLLKKLKRLNSNR